MRPSGVIGEFKNVMDGLFQNSVSSNPHPNYNPDAVVEVPCRFIIKNPNGLIRQAVHNGATPTPLVLRGWLDVTPR